MKLLPSIFTKRFALWRGVCAFAAIILYSAVSAFAADLSQKFNEMDWLYYSYGLEHKLAGAKNKDKAEIQKALEYFLQAERSGRELDLVYAHIADCYYLLENYSKAAEYGEKSVTLNPKNIAPYIRLYLCNLQMKNNEAATNVLLRCCENNTDSAEVRFLLAEHYLKGNDTTRAQTEFLKVIELEQKEQSNLTYSEYSYYYLGFIAGRQNKPEEALRYYEAAYNINNGNMGAVYMLALLYMDRYDLARAAKFAEIYLEAYPRTPAMMSVLGRIFYIYDMPYSLGFLRGGKSDAQTLLGGAVAKALLEQLSGANEEAKKTILGISLHNPNVLSCHLALAKIYANEHNVKGRVNQLLSAGMIAYTAGLNDISKRCFHEALAEDATLAEALYYLGRIHEDERNYALAISYYKQVYKRKPTSEMFLHIGYVHSLNKNYNEAFHYIDKTIKDEPENAQAWFYKGIILLEKKDYADAEKKLKQAIELDDKKESFYYYLAVALESQKKNGEAIKYLEQAVAQTSDSARINNFLGYMYAETNTNLDRALSLIQQALDNEPNNGAFLDSLGWVYYRKGLLSESLDALLKAEHELDKEESPDPIVYDHIGDVYSSLGNKEQAVKYWNKSIGLKKDEKIEQKIKGASK